MGKSLACKLFGRGLEYFKFILRNIFHFIVSAFEIIKEHYFEKKLNIETAETYYFQDDLSLCKDGQVYQPTPYGVLENTIDCLKPKPEDIFVDFGSGKGRVLFFVALRKLKRAIGVELNKELIDISRRNLDNFKLNKTPIEFIQADAAKYGIVDETIFFMFNPFGRQTLQMVIDNIKNSLLVNPRQIRIAYYSLPYSDLLDSQDFLIREEAANCKCSIWRNI